MKVRFRLASAAAVAALAVAGSAHAATAIVDELGGPLIMHGKEIPGVFGTNSPNWSTAALNAVHTDLHGSGINTNRMITLLLAVTDRGLTWMVLVDDPLHSGNGNPKPSSLGMTTTAPIFDPPAQSPEHYVNDHNNDIQQWFNHGNNTQTAAGTWTWNADDEGRGFAWAGLDIGDFVTFNFARFQDTHPGIRENNPFQFVSWNGSEWEIVARRGFTSAGQYAFSFTIIPLPAPVLLGLLGLGMVGVLRRRMMMKRA